MWTLIKDGAVSAYLPDSTRLQSVVGQESDPYEWDRAPQSGRWFALGDGLAKTPHLAVLSAKRVYASNEEAIAEMAYLEQAVAQASVLSLCGKIPLALRTDVRSFMSSTHDDSAFRRVSYTFTFRLLEPLTATALATAASISPVNTGAPSGGAVIINYKVRWADVLDKPAQFIPTAHTHQIAEVSGLTAALNSKATLVGGLLQYSQFPPEAKRQMTEVGGQAAMLALDSRIGDYATRTDAGALGDVYVLTALPASVLGNWVLLRSPSATTVNSVNSKTGSVVLSASDVGATPVSHATLADNPHNVTKAQVGLGSVADAEQIPLSQKGQAGGVATLGPDGFVLPGQLPPSITSVPQRVGLQTPIADLAAGATREHVLGTTAVRLAGIQVRALGMIKSLNNALAVRIFGSGEAASSATWGDLMYHDIFGYRGTIYKTTDESQGWTYRDMADLKIMRVRLENTGDSPIANCGVSLVMEEY